MDLIDKEIIVDCIKSGEVLKKQFETQIGQQDFNEIWFEEVTEWWRKVANKLNEIKEISFDESLVYMENEPIATIQDQINYLKQLENNTTLTYLEISSRAQEKDSLRLVYAGGYIYDADDQESTMKINRGFREDLLKLCFENPARPLRNIPQNKLEAINEAYTVHGLRKKDGYLENLYKHWAEKFKVNKKVIKGMIKLIHTEKGWFVEISDDIDVEF
jgi:hypothetical protein